MEAVQRRVGESGVFWVALGACLWGTDPVLRYGLAERASNAWIVFGEHAILTLFLAPWLLRHRADLILLKPRDWAVMLWISWGGSAIGTLCYTQAIRIGNPTVAVLLQKLQPIVAAGLAGWVLKERPPRRARYWLRAAVALGAAYLVSFGLTWPGADLTEARSLAVIFALAAAAIWGSCTVAGRYLAPRLDPMTLTSLRIVGALPLTAALALGTPAPADVDAGFAANLAAIAFVPGLLALLAYYRGLSRTSASVATLAELCFPATAAVLNWAALGTSLSPSQILGAALLVGSLLWRTKG